MIDLKNVYKEFVNDEVVTKVLHGVSIKIDRGEFLAIMGPSGSGKSTLMHILGFLDTLSKGSYIFDNKDVSKLDDDTLADYRNRKVGFVFQSFNLLPKTSVWDNVRLPILYNKDKIDLSVVDEAIKSVGLEHRRDHLSNQLSGGELQRVAIAKCLSQDVDLYLMDEPSAYLDVEQRLIVAKVVRDIMEKKGKTAFIVDHDLLFLDFLSKRLAVFNGQPAIKGVLEGIFEMEEGMNKFLAKLDLTFRRDPESNRPRANKPNSVKDREQKSTGKYYY